MSSEKIRKADLLPGAVHEEEEKGGVGMMLRLCWDHVRFVGRVRT